MKQSVSFSGDSTKKASLNFEELRNQGLEYVQKLSGDVWTDFNSHDPGVTILEQLCYALTDVAFRSSFPVEDLLSPKNGDLVDAKSNAFFSSSSILSSHPVTMLDTRKMIIDRFEQIQNVWIHTKGNVAEEMRGINHVEIVPKLNFVDSDSKAEEAFLNKVHEYLNQFRNLGERFSFPHLLKPQRIEIVLDLHFNEYIDLDETLSNVFLTLFEFVYGPVHHYSYNEMAEAGNNIEEIFAGPVLSNGFIKDEIADQKLKIISDSELHKLFSKVSGVQKCEVNHIVYNGKKIKSLTVEPGMFFHLLVDENSANKSFDKLFKNMSVFINHKKTPLFSEQNIRNMFLEIWSKKYRTFSLGKSHEVFFHQKLKGIYRNPGQYHSIQNHFPLIYGIGADGLSHNAPPERHSKANQLKTYLLLFEQHMANHLAQLENMNSFFNIDYKKDKADTYFTQSISTVSGINKLLKNDPELNEVLTEPKETFYNRKNRIYNHLLARFGEELSDIPWQISLRLNLIRNKDEFHQQLLQQKSKFLTRIENLSYYRLLGEWYFRDCNNKIQKWTSGLEQIIRIKCGISDGKKEPLYPSFVKIESTASDIKQELANNREEFKKKYRQLDFFERNELAPKGVTEKQPAVEFRGIGIKTLFKESIQFDNYRLSIPKSSDESIEVIFRKELGNWIKLFDCSSEEKTVAKIHEIIHYFVQQNSESEGLYIVDHILLNDFIEGSKYGYRFVNEYGETLFQTLEDESWSESEDERGLSLASFYKEGISIDSYSFEKEKCVLKDATNKVLGSHKFVDNSEIGNNHDELLNQTKSIIQLFNATKEERGLLHFEEMEKIRLHGVFSKNDKDFNQRRLVFQRKLKSGKIIDEDFFDMKVSIVLPNWPARFQEESFKGYLTSIIHERIPTHINNNILWLNVNQMKDFESKYNSWIEAKSLQRSADPPNKKLIDSAFGVHQKILELTN